MCHQHPQNPEHLPIWQKMSLGIPHLTVASRVYHRRKVRNLQTSGMTVYALPVIQQERGLPAKGDWILSGRGLHRALQSGRGNATHNNPSNNQLQFQINNNNSTNNNPRYMRTGGRPSLQAREYLSRNIRIRFVSLDLYSRRYFLFRFASWWYCEDIIAFASQDAYYSEWCEYFCEKTVK